MVNIKIISQAPTRIGLFGGGTDVNPYAKKYGGICVNAAINIRQHIILTDKNGVVKYPKGANEMFYWTILNQFGIGMSGLNGFQAEFDGEIESGLGSSAAAAVALIGAAMKMKGIKGTKTDIAETAWNIEVNKLQLFGGRQDQYAASFGGINVFEFGSLTSITPLTYKFIEQLYPALVLFYLGTNRKSPKIQEGFRNLTSEQKETLDNIKKLAIDGIKMIARGDIEKVGRLFDIAWDLKKRSNKGISNLTIDAMYTKAKKLGAWGGKIMGAGGGGHFLFIIDPEKKEKFIEQLGLKHIDFSIDWNGLEVRKL